MPTVGNVQRPRSLFEETIANDQKLALSGEHTFDKPRVYLGIDPGASGGLAVVYRYGVRDGSVEAVPMPATERDIWDWFVQWKDSGLGRSKPIAVIEKVTGYIGDGGNPGSAMFKFGTSYGGLRMALIAAEIPFEEITPQAWQKASGIFPRKSRGGETKTQWKNRLKSKAQQLFPLVKVTLPTADALLIAEYCMRKHEGRL